MKNVFSGDSLKYIAVFIFGYTKLLVLPVGGTTLIGVALFGVREEVKSL